MVAESIQELEPSQETQLWEQWRGSRDVKARAALFFSYSAWTRTMARYMFSRYPHPLAEWADYINLASMGVLQAIDRYDPCHGARFKTFAEPFIKGGILKGLSCYVKDHRSISPDRLSDVMDHVNLEDNDQMFNAVVNAAVDIAFGYFLESGIVDQQPVDNNPLSLFISEGNSSTLMIAVESLPIREQQIIVGHYFQGLSFTELGNLLGVTKSRISQLHSQALKRIRKQYEETDSFESLW